METHSKMFCWTLFAFFSFQTVVFCGWSPQKTLLEKLLRDYGNRSLRPVRNMSDVTLVHFRILIAQLVEFDERKQQLTINGWLKEIWLDEYLVWNPTDHGGIDTLTVSTKDIWLPDITLYDNVDSRFENIKDIDAHVTSDGYVDWMAPALLKASCMVKVRYFPFDTQQCILRFSSWAYDGGSIDLVFTNDTDASQTVFLRNGVWELVRVDVIRDVKEYECCPNPYIFILYKLTLQRASTFYYSNIIAPCLLLSILQLLVFWLPPESGEKISLGMSNLLALILFQQLIAESTPPLGDETPLIGQYFFAMVVMGCVSITSTVCVLRVYYRSNNKEIPPMIRHVVLRYLSQRLILHRLISFDKGPAKIIPNGNSTQQRNESVPSLSAVLRSDSKGHADGHDIITNGEPGIQCISCRENSIKECGNADSKHCEEHSNDRKMKECSWKDVAMFLDRIMFYLLALCMFGVFLYVVTDYLLQ
ncbi:neuronal acetylcholine receptor subunit alpha-10-like [Amphiura filiformis]|uniref:neuronal acetylcholine receptor subunit alpha-10-like n=1 Tax=Amphiura filiformis TaxID=82378 RepID=UPI003B21EC70